MSGRLHIALVVPFMNEERHLGELLASIAAQTRRPDRLVLVDDGSCDGSPAIAQAFADRFAWATVAHRPPRRLMGHDRLAGGAALRAFTWGVQRTEPSWDVIAKVDADVRLSPRTLATLEEAFARDPALGVAGPLLSGPRSGGPERRMPRDQVQGATKFYRRACFEQISPLPAILGWDTIDVMRARLAGWRTASFAVPGGDPVHLRPMGTHDGLVRGWRRWGRCAWGYGEHPLHVAAVAAQRIAERPAGLGSANYVAGWLAAAVMRAPRAEPAVRTYVRDDQLRRLRRRLAGRPTRPVAEAAP